MPSEPPAMKLPNSRIPIGKNESDLLQIAFDAMNSAPTGWVLSSLEGSILWVNPVFLRMFGFADLSAVAGRNMADLFASEGIGSVRDIARLVEENRGGDAEFEVVGEDHKPFYVTFSVSEIRDSSGELAGRMAFFIDITQRRKTQMALLESQKYLQALSTKLVHAQEDERRRVARELHDSIGASLSALKFGIEQWYEHQKKEGKLTSQRPEKIITEIQQVIEEVRRISHNLHPSILDDLGLKTAVRSFCRQQRENNPGLDIEADFQIDEDSIPKRLQLVVYRVVQECTTNAIRHGKAGTVRISLTPVGDEIQLEIRDDGRGFDVSTAWEKHDPETGIGIESMKERTELTGGRLSIDSAIGRGAVIRCRWPRI